MAVTKAKMRARRKTGPSGELCARCYYFIPHDEPIGAGYNAGHCHRFPPSQTLDDDAPELLVTRYVHAEAWCGEFKSTTVER